MGDKIIHVYGREPLKIDSCIFLWHWRPRLSAARHVTEAVANSLVEANEGMPRGITNETSP